MRISTQKAEKVENDIYFFGITYWSEEKWFFIEFHPYAIKIDLSKND